MVEQVERIAEELEAGRQVQPVSVREFLRWFGAKRRGYWIVDAIREELAKRGVQTIPDFESAYIDAPIAFASADEPDKKDVEVPLEGVAVSVETSEPETSVQDEVSALIAEDPTYRLSKLAAANQAVVSIKPNGSTAEAATLMMSRGFSQLPVMTTEREVKGVVTWASLAINSLSQNRATEAREIMLPAQEIRSDASLFDAVPIIVQHDYVLVRGPNAAITGIITASDLSNQFRSSSEPFLLISEIENLLRQIIGSRFTVEEIAQSKDPGDSQRKINGVSDLNFGEYVRILENDSRWQKLNLPLDRATVCKTLDRVREIRNDVVHFDPDGIDEDDLNRLRECAGFLKQLRTMVSQASA